MRTPGAVSASFTDSEQHALRVLFDTLIPPDQDPGGWEGGVERLLDGHLDTFMAWAREPLREALTQLQEKGFDQQPSQSGREALISELPAKTLEALLRVAYEGYYANTSEPSGWHVAGFNPVPTGVAPIESVPLPVIALGDVRRHYDAVIVGAGAGGGVAAHELATAGWDVLVVERGRNFTNGDLRGNHLQGKRTEQYEVTAGPGDEDFRILVEDGKRTVLPGDGNGQEYGLVAMTVGGGTRVWQGMAWRFYPEDFAMASTYGVPSGSTLADWPFGYEELAPYYDRVEDLLGVAGDTASPMSRRTPRTGPYPMPPLPPDGARTYFGGAATRLGWDVSPIPFAINSVPRDGRPACVRCSQCVGHACPVDAKNGTHNTFLPRSIATGRCQMLVAARVTGIRHDGLGRATGIRVLARDSRGATIDRSVSADVILVAAGAVETPRLLLSSGLGNEWVGRNHHSHGISSAMALRGPRAKTQMGPGHSVATDRFLHGREGVWGGGVIFDLPMPYPLVKAQIGKTAAESPFGQSHKAFMRERQLTIGAASMVQEVPHESTRVGIDARRTDALGMPVSTLQWRPHPATIEAADFMRDRCIDWVREVGGTDIRANAVPGVAQGAEHSAGTARLGVDPGTSACDPTGLLWGTQNVYVIDASLHPTNGGVNPALTVMANSMRVTSFIAHSRRAV